MGMELRSMKKANSVEKSDLDSLREQEARLAPKVSPKDLSIASELFADPIQRVGQMSEEELQEFKTHVKEAQAAIISEQDKRKEQTTEKSVQDRIADIFG